MDALARALRSGLRAIVDTCQNTEFQATSSEHPTVVILDPYSALQEFKVQDIRTVKELWPKTRCLIVTECNDQRAVGAALVSGVHGYLLKSETVDTLLAGVQLVRSGGLAFSLLATSLLAAKKTSALSPLTPSAPEQRGLSPREIQVIQLISSGNVDSEIALSLDISVRTVQRHVTNVLNKLNCRTRSEAVAKAIGGARQLLTKG